MTEEPAVLRAWTMFEQLFRYTGWVCLSLAGVCWIVDRSDLVASLTLTALVCDLYAQHSRDMRFTKAALLALESSLSDVYLQGRLDAFGTVQRVIDDRLESRPPATTT